MRRVSKDDFYRSVRNKDAVVRILPGPHPYTSVFKLRYGGEELGRVVGRTESGLAFNDYFLPDL